MGRYDPPFQITDEIMNLTAPISEQLGHIDSRSRETIHPYLRRANQIRTIHSSLAIEHNSLSLEQVTALPSRSSKSPHSLKVSAFSAIQTRSQFPQSRS